MQNSRYATNNNHNNHTAHTPDSSTPTSQPQNTHPTTERKVFEESVALADLGSARFNHDTAEITDRDISLHTHIPTHLRQGRAPKGLENQAFAWSTFQYTTDERDELEEKKGELHDGQLHRMNRVARGEGDGVKDDGYGGDRGGGRGGRGGRGRGGRWGRAGAGGEQQRDDGRGDALCAGRKVGGNVPPLAKGMSKEMTKDMFWDGPIV